MFFFFHLLFPPKQPESLLLLTSLRYVTPAAACLFTCAEDSLSLRFSASISLLRIRQVSVLQSKLLLAAALPLPASLPLRSRLNRVSSAALSFFSSAKRFSSALRDCLSSARAVSRLCSLRERNKIVPQQLA